MKDKKVFFLLPSLLLHSPVKGTIAICNRLAEHMPVTIVSLKTGLQEGLTVHPDVKIVSLENVSNWSKKICAYKDILRNEGTRENVLSISYGFSADFVNIFMNRYANIICSVRENREKNYYYGYGWIGSLYCWLHNTFLKRFDKVIAISDEISANLNRLKVKNIEVVYNFIDEHALEKHRLERKDHDGKMRFVFLGRIERIKRPDIIIHAFDIFRKRYNDSFLNIIGDGPLENEMKELVRRLNLEDYVRFHGFLPNPYNELQENDCMLLPSESEGVSRSCMEALFFDIPCIMRDAGGNNELIQHGVNGSLFKSDNDLIESMYEMTDMIMNKRFKSPLLPYKFRSDYNINRFIEKIINKC